MVIEPRSEQPQRGAHVTGFIVSVAYGGLEAQTRPRLLISTGSKPRSNQCQLAAPATPCKAKAVRTLVLFHKPRASSVPP